MATQILSDCKLFVGAYDLSGYMSAHTLDYKVDLPEGTVYGDTSRRRHAGGLKMVNSKHEGLWDGAVGTVDEILFDRIGASNVPVTVCPTDGAELELGYFFNATSANYAPGAKIGELMQFSVDCEGADGKQLIRGRVGMNRTTTATSNAAAITTLSSVSATQKLYAALHVLSVSGTSTPTLTAIVESAVTNFSTVTTRITFGAKTAIGSEMATPVDGPITDAFWRVRWTITGTNPSFKAIVVLGIQ